MSRLLQLSRRLLPPALAATRVGGSARAIATSPTPAIPTVDDTSTSQGVCLFRGVFLRLFGCLLKDYCRISSFEGFEGLEGLDLAWLGLFQGVSFFPRLRVWTTFCFRPGIGMSLGWLYCSLPGIGLSLAGLHFEEFGTEIPHQRRCFVFKFKRFTFLFMQWSVRVSRSGLIVVCGRLA